LGNDHGNLHFKIMKNIFVTQHIFPKVISGHCECHKYVAALVA